MEISRERKVLTGEWGGKEGKSRAALDFQIESGEDYLLSSASSIFFNSGLEGRGASAETMLPFLSKTMETGNTVDFIVFCDFAPAIG